MTEVSSPSPVQVCPRCDANMVAAIVRTVIWHDDRPAIVEDIPAYVCSGCAEQFYDDAVSEALHDLVGEGFPVAAAQKEIRVPIFSLTGRIRRPAPQSDEYIVED